MPVHMANNSTLFIRKKPASQPFANFCHVPYSVSDIYSKKSKNGPNAQHWWIVEHSTCHTTPMPCLLSFRWRRLRVKAHGSHWHSHLVSRSHGGWGAKCLVVLSDLSDTQLGGTSHVCLLSGRGRQISTKESNYIIVLHSYNLQLSSQQSQGCYLADGQLTPNNLVARNFRLVPQEEVPGWGCWIHGGLDLDRENRKKLTN